jgi:hypothetical protein
LLALLVLAGKVIEMEYWFGLILRLLAGPALLAPFPPCPYCNITPIGPAASPSFSLAH